MSGLAAGIALHSCPTDDRRPVRASRHDRASRGLDIAVALIALAFLLPLLLLIALAVVLASPGPPLFAQTRIGRGGRPFRCYKFRTMTVDADRRLADVLRRDEGARREWTRDHKLRRDPRVVGIGEMLRRSSLDELPQFLNILLGDMSLVGPRPIVAAETWRYGRRFAAYCRVRPGLTGLWQISGRTRVSYRRRVALDVAYVRARTFGFDLRIIALTLPSMIAHGGC